MSTTPVYGTVPGPVSIVNAVTVPIGSANGPTLTSGTIRNIPTVGVVGQKTEVEKITTNTVGIDLQAYDGDGLRRTMRGARGQPQLLWRVMGANTFRNNTVSRAAQEVAMAISPFVETNTGGIITVK
jgi:hypothetical protein